MKFKFALEKVLKHKKILEDQAKREFGEISKILQEQEEFLAKLEADLQTSYQNKFEVQKIGGNISAYLDFFYNYYISQKKLIENQNQIITGLKKILEEKREFLIHAAREHKTFTMLKEKKRQEFRKELKKREQKHLDELNMMRHEKAI